MKSLLRRWFRCCRGQHRETLDMDRMELRTSYQLIAHDLHWRCVDCGQRTWFGLSDNIQELRRKTGRHA